MSPPKTSATLALRNPNFGDGLDGWEVPAPPNWGRAVVPTDLGPVLELTIPDEAGPNWLFAQQTLDVHPGQILEARVTAGGRNLHDGWGTFCALTYYDATGAHLAQARSDVGARGGAWAPLVIRSIVPEDTVVARIQLMLHGRGTARFRDVGIALLGDTTSEPLDGPVTLSVTDTVACESLVGFGFEDDGWFFNQSNRDDGVGEADYALRERRIEWLDPDWVRMFCWYPEWNPSGDWKTFTFDSDGMESHYKSLEVYQRIGAEVNIVGVRWGNHDPYADLEAHARANGALLEHLIREKGFTCIKYWTALNEPNIDWTPPAERTFEEFVHLHRLVREEFARRGLDVALVGSDDANSLRWFRQCVETPAYRDAVDMFTSHRYFMSTEHGLRPGDFIADRTALIEAHAPGKPFVVAEYGFLPEGWNSHHNPLMKTYDYALRTTEFCIEALNHGAAGTSIWVLNEMYYTNSGGSIMDFGLWGRAKDGSQIRPVYHAKAMFTRLTNKGDTSFEVASSHPDRIKAARVGDTLFWVNLGDEAAQIALSGFQAESVCVMKENTLHGDGECGETLAVEGRRFTAPPRSFGYAATTQKWSL